MHKKAAAVSLAKKKQTKPSLFTLSQKNVAWYFTYKLKATLRHEWNQTDWMEFTEISLKEYLNKTFFVLVLGQNTDRTKYLLYSE